ncbi:hypothetical protein RQ359_001157 [Sulfuracidifex metallicus DSM 6482 = JCM 9184]|nr:hypothetical protein RQ359_001157 [Sulfuracidifex metallicus DSM 6482 = JCM 9184]
MSHPPHWLRVTAPSQVGFSHNLNSLNKLLLFIHFASILYQVTSLLPFFVDVFLGEGNEYFKQ